jgi:hypothetical protein
MNETQIGSRVCSQVHLQSLRKDGHNNVPEALVDYRSVIAHLYRAHVKLFYRCTACPRAFAKKEAIYEHRTQAHDSNSNCDPEKYDKGMEKRISRKGKAKRNTKGIRANLKSNMADFTLLYKASFLKNGNMLFATREEIEKRIKVVISKWPRTFAFRCCGCQCFFSNANELSNHNSRWCQMQVILRKLICL